MLAYAASLPASPGLSRAQLNLPAPPSQVPVAALLMKLAVFAMQQDHVLTSINQTT